MALFMPSSICYKIFTKQLKWFLGFISMGLNPYFIRNKLNSTSFKTIWPATVVKRSITQPTPLLSCRVHLDYLVMVIPAQ